MIKGREGKGATSTDLLVCFPTRAHLTLMPKPICSPSRPSEPNKRHHHHHHIHRLKKAGTRGGGGAGQASPLSWAKNKQMGSDISEPTSPKVTCAGQIKVRPKPTSSCRNWQSVMEEIERLHNNNKTHKVKKPSWVEALGIKKDVMQFLTCLRSIRFDFRCFGAFPTSDIITSDDDEDEEDDEEEDDPDNQVHDNGDETSRTFSKWFMVLQDNQNGVNKKEDSKGRDNMSYGEESVSSEPCAPPSNALLLMRCRSAPAKSWLEEREEEEDDDDGVDESEEREKEEEEERKKKENMVVMRYDTNLYKFSTEIAKETWVVGDMRDTLSRSRSWKR